MAPLSDDRPLREVDEMVRVSPSRVEKFASCELRWLLETCGGSDAPATGQTVGSAVHALAELAADEAFIDEAVLGEQLDAVWSDLELGGGWFSRQERQRAQLMIRRLVGWLRANPRKLLAAEQEFRVEVGRAEVRGRVDRLEVDDAGRAVIVDLKTGTQRPTTDELAEHPQLGVYQLAVELGAFAEYGVTEPGGASLVQLGKAALTNSAREQAQPALSEAEDPAWARHLVLETAEGMAASTFRAMENKQCGHCPVRRCCPVQPEGHGVTA
jgi:RecB family exonuclease